MKVGTRVEMHPATDTWMRGDRYGEIVGQGSVKTNMGYQRVYRVKLDKSGRTIKVSPRNLSEIA